MDSTRQNKVSRLIQKELSGIFEKELRGAFGNILITLTKVKISPDLAIASVYASIYGTQNKKDVIDKINNNPNSLRKLLSDKVKKQLRIIPRLRFYIDDSLDYSEKIDKLLKGDH